MNLCPVSKVIGATVLTGEFTNGSIPLITTNQADFKIDIHSAPINIKSLLWWDEFQELAQASLQQN